MFRHLIVWACTCVFSLSVLSQQYNTAVGVKGDWSNLDINLAELSVKHFFTGFDALETNIGFGRRYLWLEGMYHRNQPLKGNIDWYGGAGLDLGYWNTNYDNRYDNETHSGYWSGINAVVGLEYTTDFIPINLALDLGPTIRVIPERQIGLRVGFACRFAFGH